MVENLIFSDFKYLGAPPEWQIEVKTSYSNIYLLTAE